MFSVDEATAEAIRRAYDEGGECVRIIAGWQPLSEEPAAGPKRRRARTAGPKNSRPFPPLAGTFSAMVCRALRP